MDHGQYKVLVNYLTYKELPDFAAQCRNLEAAPAKARAKMLKDCFLRKAKEFNVIADTEMLMRICGSNSASSSRLLARRTTKSTSSSLHPFDGIGKQIVKDEEVRAVIERMHNTDHLGQKRTMKAVVLTYHVKNSKEAVKIVYQECLECASNLPIVTGHYSMRSIPVQGIAFRMVL